MKIILNNNEFKINNEILFNNFIKGVELNDTN